MASHECKLMIKCNSGVVLCAIEMKKVLTKEFGKHAKFSSPIAVFAVINFLQNKESLMYDNMQDLYQMMQFAQLCSIEQLMLSIEHEMHKLQTGT